MWSVIVAIFLLILLLHYSLHRNTRPVQWPMYEYKDDQTSKQTESDEIKNKEEKPDIQSTDAASESNSNCSDSSIDT